MQKRTIIFVTMLIFSATGLSAKGIKCNVIDGWMKSGYSISNVSLNTDKGTAQLRIKGKLGEKVKIKSKTISIGVKHTWSQKLKNYNKDKSYVLDFVVRHKTNTDAVDFAIYHKGSKTPSNNINCVLE